MRALGQSLFGCLLGTAVGDAIGLPREGLAPQRARRRLGGAPLGHALFAGRGMVSDDTEHTCLVGQALLTGYASPEQFARALAWQLRWWFCGLPAGIGKATARACLRLWRGVPPERSGVRSAGNGAAMRAALIGVYYRGDPVRLRQYVSAASRSTHTDDRAVEGALAIALAARHGSLGRPCPETVLAEIDAALTNDELRRAVAAVADHLQQGSSAEEFAAAMDWTRGVSGYVVPTVAAALFGWLRWPDDFREAVEQVILLGGDADTTGAIVGALTGATLGARAIPREWLTGLCEWPRTVRWMAEMAHRLSRTARGQAAAPMPVSPAALLLRNLWFLLVVLGHGLRRLGSAS